MQSQSATNWSMFVLTFLQVFLFPGRSVGRGRLFLRIYFVPQIAKVEKLKPLEVELRRLEDLSESIVNDFAYMKKREEEMRDTNGETNAQLLKLTVYHKLKLSWESRLCSMEHKI